MLEKKPWMRNIKQHFSFKSKKLVQTRLASRTLPLSDLAPCWDVLGTLEASCGPLSWIELGLFFGKGLGWMSSSILTSNSSSFGPDGVESGSYQDADSSKTTSRLTRTARVKGLKHLYAFCLDNYHMRIHFSDFASNFCRFSFGMRTFAMLPNTLRCERIDFLPTRISYRVSSCTPLVVHRFMRKTAWDATSDQ